MNIRRIKVVPTLLGFVLLVTAYQSCTTDVIPPPVYPEQDAPCYGEPIEVDYIYGGGMMHPHACKPQCADGKPRYIVYTNNKATQCGSPPDCSDWGEDNGVTCSLNN